MLNTSTNSSLIVITQIPQQIPQSHIALPIIASEVPQAVLAVPVPVVPVPAVSPPRRRFRIVSINGCRPKTRGRWTCRDNVSDLEFDRLNASRPTCRVAVPAATATGDHQAEQKNDGDEVGNEPAVDHGVGVELQRRDDDESDGCDCESGTAHTTSTNSCDEVDTDIKSRDHHHQAGDEVSATTVTTASMSQRPPPLMKRSFSEPAGAVDDVATERHFHQHSHFYIQNVINLNEVEDDENYGSLDEVVGQMGSDSPSTFQHLSPQPSVIQLQHPSDHVEQFSQQQPQAAPVSQQAKIDDIRGDEGDEGPTIEVEAMASSDRMSRDTSGSQVRVVVDHHQTPERRLPMSMRTMTTTPQRPR